MNASTTTSATPPPKMDLFGDMYYNNLQSANRYAFVLSLSSKFVFGNKIPSGKADLSTLCMMPKPAFIEEVDDDNNDTDIEHVSHVHVVFARDNQTYQSVMGRKIAGPLGKQELSEAELSKQKQHDEWLHYHRCDALNFM